MASSKKSKSARPTDGDPGPGYAPPPTGDYGPPQGFGPLPGYGPPAGSEPPPEAPVAMRPDGPARARTGLVVLIAFLFELVLLAGWGNQWVTRRVFNHVGGAPTLHNDLLRASVTYQWRFSPVGGSDFAHMWLAQLLYVVAVLVLSTLLIIPAVRGVVTFWRAFFGVWTAVFAASLVAAYMRAAIVDPSASGNPLGSRANNALFGTLAPNSLVAIAGLGFGLLVALLTAIIATTTRRTPMVAVPPAPEDGPPPPPAEPPPPFYGEVDNSRTQVIDTGRQPGGYGFEKDPAARTEGARHAADFGQDSDTRQLPAMDFGASAPAAVPVPERGAEPEQPVEAESHGVASPPEASGAHTESSAGPTDELAGQQPDVTTQFPRPVTGGYAPPASPESSEQVAAEPSTSEPAVAEQRADAPEPGAGASEPDPGAPDPATDPPLPPAPETTRFADPPES